MKIDYSLGFLFIVGVFIILVAVVAASALPLITESVEQIKQIGR